MATLDLTKITGGLAFSNPDTATQVYGTSDLYNDAGTGWVPQYTDANKQPVSSTTYHDQYGGGNSSGGNNNDPTGGRGTNYNVGDIVDGMRWNGVGWDPTGPQEVSEADRLRGEISSAWDGYINDLPNSMNYYNQQGEAMTGRANTFKQENLATLQDSKAQSLRDMQKVARGALQAGNNYLGQLGAGDSSARDMYSYAINKQQQQQTGELDRFTMTEERKINTEYQTQIFGIQQWLAEQQNAIATAQREGRLQKGLDLANVSRDLLNNALQAAATARQNAEARKSALMQWAADNSLNATQLAGNMSAIGQPMGEMQTYSAPTSALTYYSSGTNKDEQIQ